MKLSNIIEIEGLEGPSDTPKAMGKRGFSLPGNAGREFGEKFMKDFIGPGKFAELWTAFEATYPKFKSELTKTFAKTNDLLKYIKPEKGDETYRVSTMPEAAAQELDDLLNDALEMMDFVSNQQQQPSETMVKEVIRQFDNTFSDMLAIFTSNTAGDTPLEPYKKTNIGFGINENEEADKAANLWNQYKGKIFADNNVERGTRRSIQIAVLTDPKYAVKWIEDWAEKNHFISKSEKPPFEEIKLSNLVTDKQKQDAEELANKTKQIASKAGEEMANFAKDVYDTPTVKRLRAYVKQELNKLGQKLVDKYAVDQPGKQMKIPFEDMNENLRNWFKKEKWKRIDTQGNIAGDCGTMPKGKKTQRCLPAAKARSLSKKDRAATSRKKTKSNKQFVSNTKAAKVKNK